MPPNVPPIAAGSAEFRRVLAAEAMSNFGAMLSRLAIPWLAALVLQATPLQMGGLLVADVVAGALGALWLGTWVDRLDKRRVMLLADGARAVLLAGLAAGAAAGRLNMLALVAYAALTGLATMAFELARSAWTAERLEPAQLTPANARLAVATSLSETLAFALGGWLYQAVGAVISLLLDAVSYLASALCLKQIGTTAPPDAGPAEGRALASGGMVTPPSQEVSLVQQMGQGVRALWKHPALRALAGADAAVALGFSLTGTSYMIYLAREVGFSPGWLGVAFATGGLGAIVGAALAPGLGARWGSGRCMAWGLALAATGQALVLLAREPTLSAWGWIVAQQVVGDAGHTLRDVQDRGLRQRLAPPELRARVDAGMRTVSQGATLLGALCGGALATTLGTRWALASGALCCAAAAAWVAARLRNE